MEAKMYVQMEEDPLTVDSTIKDADSPEDFI